MAVSKEQQLALELKDYEREYHASLKRKDCDHLECRKYMLMKKYVRLNLNRKLGEYQIVYKK